LCEWLCRHGVREPQLHEILIATGEACANAVEHSGAEGSRAGPAAWIEASCDQATVRIVVADRGVWKEPDPAGSLGGRRGRGRLLMAELMDQAAIRTGPSGTTVQLVKKLTDTNGRGTRTRFADSAGDPAGHGS
jgi:anti-sigma regulatory factor (Ser/Thr protein kinase)